MKPARLLITLLIISGVIGCSAGTSGTTTSNQFVTLAENGLTSPNGYNYTFHASTPKIIGIANKLIYANGQWVAVGASSSELLHGMVATSNNGISYNQTTLDYPILKSITYGFNKYIATGDSGTIIYSTNLTNWQNASINPAISATIKDISCSTSICYALADKSIYSSVDGITWNQVNNFTSSATLNAINQANGLFVAVGENGSIAYTNNNGNWTQVPTSTPITNYQLQGIAFGNGNFIAVGGTSSIAVLSHGQIIIQGSADAQSWSVVYSKSFEILNQHTLTNVVYANGRFAVLGEGLNGILPLDTFGYSTTGESGTWNLQDISLVATQTLAYGSVTY